MIRMILLAIVVFLVSTFPAHGCSCSSSATFQTHAVGYWGMLPLGIVASMLISGSSPEASEDPEASSAAPGILGTNWAEAGTDCGDGKPARIQSSVSVPDVRQSGDANMAKADAVFLFIGTYPDEVSARLDYDVVKDLHLAGAVGTYDAAVVTKNTAREDPHQQRRDDHPTHGMGRNRRWRSGRHPVPAFDHRKRLVGGAIGGVSGHLWKGMSRSDVKELGDLIDKGEAALIVIGESTIQAALEKAELRAQTHIAKELKVRPKDLDDAAEEVEKRRDRPAGSSVPGRSSGDRLAGKWLTAGRRVGP